MAKYFREDTVRIYVAFDGVDPLPAALNGLWATAEGGALEADSQKTRPGGLTKQKSVGGPASRGDATATIQMQDTIGSQTVRDLEALVGKRHGSIKVEFCDPEATLAEVKSNVHWQGSLKSVATPSVDVNGSAVTFLTVVLDCDEEQIAA